MSDFKAVKFQVGQPVEIVLSHDEPRKTDSTRYPGKTIIWYGINELINGENGFNASEKLCELITLQNYKSRDRLKIEKCQSEIKDGKSFQFFKVNDQSLYDLNQQFNKPAESQPSITSPPLKAESIIQKVDIDSNSPFTDAQRLNILWAEYENKNGIVKPEDQPAGSKEFNDIFDK